MCIVSLAVAFTILSSVAADCPTTIILKCSKPNGTQDCSPSMEEGSRAIIPFTTGTEDKNLYCKDAMWVRSCPALSSTSTKLSCQFGAAPLPCNSKVLPVGTVATISCEEGMILKDNQTEITCQQTGRWTKPVSPCVEESESFKKYTKIPGLGSWKVYRTLKTWYEANTTCVQDGGDLSVIDSMEKKNAVMGLINATRPSPSSSSNNQHYWTGVNALMEYGMFVVPSGAPASTEGWCPGEPNGSPKSNDKCGAFISTSKCLNDLNCYSAFRFICEKP